MLRNAAISVTDTLDVDDAARTRLDRVPSGGLIDDRPMTIGDVARHFGITVRALRFYEAKRLITPQRHGAVRLYHRRDCERLALVVTGRRLGFTLAEIGHLLDKRDGADLHLTREQCVAQINLLEQQKRGLEIAIAELRQIYTSFYRRFLEDAGRHSA